MLKQNCSYNDMLGECKFVDEYNGDVYSGLCPGNNNFKCFITLQDSKKRNLVTTLIIIQFIKNIIQKII